MLTGLAVFAATYLLIAGRPLKWLPIDRPAGALIGAVLAVATGASTPLEAEAAIDKSTLVLLFAVMGMGAFLALDGIFDRAAPRLARATRTRAGLLAALIWGAGALSAIVTNDAVCVLLAPVVVGWIRRWKLPAFPFLVALATASNTGSVATLVGNPQSMLCASLGHLSFRSYAAVMVPVAVAGLAVNHAIVWAFFRTQLHDALPDDRPTDAPIFSRGSLITLAVLAGTVGLYTAGANMTFTALGGFVVLLIAHRVEPAHIWEKIDWSILLFFGSLFVAVDAFARSGAPEWAFEHVPLYAGTGGLASYLRTGLYFLVGSNVVTNVPFILVVRAEMAHLPSPTLGWQMLAMASTFAGNLTLLGSVANVIVADKSQGEGGLPFWAYFRIGFPVAVVTTLVGTMWVVLVR